MHGLAKRAVKSARVGRVDIGDELLVIRSDKHWEVHDGRGYLGRLRWSAADDGKTDKRFHTVVDYPDRGTLMVIRLVIFGIDDKVIDFGGYVVPDASRP